MNAKYRDCSVYFDDAEFNFMHKAVQLYDTHIYILLKKSTIIVIIGACACWALFVVTLTNTLHYIHIWSICIKNWLVWQVACLTGHLCSWEWYNADDQCVRQTNSFLSTLSGQRERYNWSNICEHDFCRVHHDVIKWKHFPRYWPFVREIHRSPMNSNHKGQWRGALIFSVICAFNKRLSKQ